MSAGDRWMGTIRGERVELTEGVSYGMPRVPVYFSSRLINGRNIFDVRDVEDLEPVDEYVLSPPTGDALRPVTLGVIALIDRETPKEQLQKIVSAASTALGYLRLAERREAEELKNVTQIESLASAAYDVERTDGALAWAILPNHRRDFYRNFTRRILQSPLTEVP